jgi:hypothetical protein
MTGVLSDSRGEPNLFPFVPTVSGILSSVELAPEFVTGTNAGEIIITASCCNLATTIDSIPINNVPSLSNPLSAWEILTFDSAEQPQLDAGTTYWWGIYTTGNEYIDIQASAASGPFTTSTLTQGVWLTGNSDLTPLFQANTSSASEPSTFPILAVIGIGGLFLQFRKKLRYYQNDCHHP